jgi:hypothetical protein
VKHFLFTGTAAAPDAAATANELSELSLSLVRASMAGAQRSNAQRQKVLEAGRMEEQIRASSAQSGSNSRQTAERTEAVAQDTDRGHAIMEATSVAMQQMSLTVTESATLMREFVERMAEVSKVVGTISEIARQTNLLALNAAVEAAHAGHEGDGFTVIAQEIRVLADRARHSTTEIGDKITGMAASARAAEAAMQIGKEAAEVSIRQSLEVQRSFQAIRDSMQQVQKMSAEVADASNRQIAAGERVSTSMGEIDRMALESTFEADASAEMSMRMVGCAMHVREVLAARSFANRRKLRKVDPDAERLLGQIAQHHDTVGRAMEMLKQECNRSGAVSVYGQVEVQGKTAPCLRFGSVSAAQGNSWVDTVNQRTGCVATIFGRNDVEFIRLSTNVKRPDGHRATGTILNPRGAAIQELKVGSSFQGAVYVLGKPFLAVYEPIFSAERQVIGAYYVGFALAS